MFYKSLINKKFGHNVYVYIYIYSIYVGVFNLKFIIIYLFDVNFINMYS